MNFCFTLLLVIPLTGFSQIVNIEERRIKGTNDSTYWYGSVRAGASVAKVKSDILQFNGTAHVQYKYNKTLALLLLDTRFLRAGDTDFNSTGFAHLRHNYKLSDRLVTEAFAQTQYNKLLLIELRALAGGGIRYQMLKSEDGKQRIYSGLAYLYEHNRYLEGAGEEQLHRLSTYVSFTFRPWEGVKLVNTTYFQPRFSDFGNYRLSTEWRLDTPLGKKLSFFTDFTYMADKTLPIEAPAYTYNWTNGLTWRF